MKRGLALLTTPRRASRLAVAVALTGAVATAAPTAIGARAAHFAEGLHIATGSIVDPAGRTWVADHNGGFCRLTEPAADAPARIDHSPADPTCLGGLLPGALAGPDAAGAPAFVDPSPNFPNSGDEIVLVPDGAAPSSEVMRLHWNPNTERFTHDPATDVISMAADPTRAERSRPTIASLGPDGKVYVGFQASGTIQRIVNPAAANPQIELVGGTSDGRGVASLAAGRNAAGQITVYVGEAGGLRQIRPGVSATTEPAPFALPLVADPLGGPAAPALAGALAYDLTRDILYAGTAEAATPSDIGSDSVHAYQVRSTPVSPAFPITDLTVVGGLSVDGPSGHLRIVDDPAIVLPGEPMGTGRMFHVGLPVARIDAGPAGATADATPSFAFSGDPAVQCKLVRVSAPASDPGFAACPAGTANPGPLGDGDYRFVVRSVAAATGLADSRAFTVDTVAPAKPSIVAPTTGSLSPAAPWFAFSTPGEQPGYTCSLDGAPMAPCAPGYTYPIGPDGQPTIASSGTHTLVIAAVDAAGNTSPPSDLRSFQVDATIPTVTISSPVAGPTSSTSATLAFSASEGGVAYGCRLDDAPFAACSPASPPAFTSLADGPHTVEVHARDAAGNLGPAARVAWVVDTIAPEILTQGWSTRTAPTTSFALVANEPVTFACGIDGGPLAPCSGALSLVDLTVGPVHTITVRATDVAGHVTTVTHAFRASNNPTAPPGTEQTPPSIIITSPAAGAVTKGALSASFTVSDASGVDSVECAIDAAALQACASPLAITGLDVGQHVLTVRAYDVYGNARTVVRTWTVSSAGPGGLDTPLDPLATAPAGGLIAGLRIPAALRATAASQNGLPIAVSVPESANLVRVRVLRAPARGARPGRSVVTIFRRVPRGTTVRLRLNQRRLRTAMATGGRFLVEVRVGTGRMALGAPVLRSVTVRPPVARP